MIREIFTKPEVLVFLSAMSPFVNIKLAIPLGLKFGLSKILTLILGVVGSLIFATLLLFFIEPISFFFRKHSPAIDKAFIKLFHLTRKKHSKNFTRYGALFIILITALPIPGNGSTTGALISFLFGINKWKALLLIVIGTILEGIALLAGFGSAFALIDKYF